MKDIKIFAKWTSIVVFSIILSGWTLSVLWGWFIVSKFGLPRLSIFEAFGISLLITFLLRNVKRDVNQSDALLVFAQEMGSCVVSLVLGFIIKQLGG